MVDVEVPALRDSVEILIFLLRRKFFNLDICHFNHSLKVGLALMFNFEVASIVPATFRQACNLFYSTKHFSLVITFFCIIP
jgi:hypothetical protein